MHKAARTTADMARLAMFVVLLLEVVSMTSATPCEYNQKMERGQTYYVYSPKYPDLDKNEVDCRWVAHSEQGSVININCSLNIHQTADCTADYLTVALSGDLKLDTGHRYCGDGNLLLTSTDSAVAFEFVVGSSEHGSRFLCSIIAVSTQDPTCDCGLLQSRQARIVGGSETAANEYPMMAGVVDIKDGTIFCGATIISTRFVVTATHCAENRHLDKVVVVVGEHDITHGNDTKATRLFRISRWIIHPKFEDTTYANDIALIKLSSEIVFNKDVGPACLPIRLHADTFEGQLVTMLGWGTTSFGGPVSPRLKQAQLKVIGRKDCNSRLGGHVTKNEMCTFAPGKDACQNDSGGPVLWQDPETGRLHLVGVISHGSGCATEYPAINTRVGAYIDWIQKNTNESAYCIK